MFPLLVVALVVVPLAELSVIVLVGQHIGVLATLLLLLAFSALGATLAKREGLAAWRRFRRALQTGRTPATEAVDGALILLAGALLLTPGFLTDVAGLALLVPGVRGFARRRLPWLRRRGRRLGAQPASTKVIWGRSEDAGRRSSSSIRRR